MTAVDLTQSVVLSSHVEIADTFFTRMRGLLGREALLPGEALVITRCNSIHMFGMKFSIDAIFLDNRGKVIGLVRNIQPNRFSPVFWPASRALELPAGTIDRAGTAVGNIIQIL